MKEQENRLTNYRENQLKTTKRNYDKGGIDQYGFPDKKSDDL